MDTDKKSDIENEQDLNVSEKKDETSDKSKKDLKKKSKKEKGTVRINNGKNSEQQTTRIILFGILAVGICLLAVSVAGIIGVSSDMKKAQSQEIESTTQGNDGVADENIVVQNVPDVTQNNQSNGNEQQNTQPADNQNGAPASDAEWLSFFNNSVNKLKTGGASFTKSKQTATQDISLSNKLAQTYVSSVKDKFLSDETVKTDIAKGDTSSALKNVSPEGVNYVSALSMGDIKSISHTTNSNGNYVVRIDMNDMTNPDASSAYGKIFDFMLVDDVEKTYAPDIGATVARENISLVFSGCYAEAEIKPDGTLVKYSTYVNAHMILKGAKISVVTTDLDAALASNTVYDNIVW